MYNHKNYTLLKIKNIIKVMHVKGLEVIKPNSEIYYPAE